MSAALSSAGSFAGGVTSTGRQVPAPAQTSQSVPRHARGLHTGSSLPSHGSSHSANSRRWSGTKRVMPRICARTWSPSSASTSASKWRVSFSASLATTGNSTGQVAIFSASMVTDLLSPQLSAPLESSLPRASVTVMRTRSRRRRRWSLVVSTRSVICVVATRSSALHAASAHQHASTDHSARPLVSFTVPLASRIRAPALPSRPRAGMPRSCRASRAP